MGYYCTMNTFLLTVIGTLGLLRLANRLFWRSDRDLLLEWPLFLGQCGLRLTITLLSYNLCVSLNNLWHIGLIMIPVGLTVLIWCFTRKILLEWSPLSGLSCRKTSTDSVIHISTQFVILSSYFSSYRHWNGLLWSLNTWNPAASWNISNQFIPT